MSTASTITTEVRETSSLPTSKLLHGCHISSRQMSDCKRETEFLARGDVKGVKYQIFNDFMLQSSLTLVLGIKHHFPGILCGKDNLKVTIMYVATPKTLSTGTS